MLGYVVPDGPGGDHRLAVDPAILTRVLVLTSATFWFKAWVRWLSTARRSAGIDQRPSARAAQILTFRHWHWLHCLRRSVGWCVLTSTRALTSALANPSAHQRRTHFW